MGNYRFRLSDMMPNAWFYKLKEMGKSTTRNHNSINKKHPTSTAATANISQHQQQPLKPKQPNNHSSYPRKSYYYTRELIHNSPANSKSTQPHFPDPPRKSSRQRKLTNKRILRHSSPKLVTAGCSCRCRATLWTNKSSDSPPDYSASFSSSDSSDSFPPEFRSDQVLPAATFDKMVAWSSSCGCNQVIDSNADDIIIDVDNKSLGTNFDKLDLSDLDLPPIITKPPKFVDKVEDVNKKQTKKTTGYRKSSAKYKETNAHGSLSVELVKEESVTMKERKSSNSNSFRRHVNSPGLRLRVNSPRIASRRIQAHGSGRKSVSSSSSSSSRRSLSESLAIVKSSFDPQRDFKESMVEMIVENNIRASKDLEDLLACYLSLNSDEYHGLIIEVFKQIWLDLNETPSKDRHHSSSSTLASK